MNQSTVVQYADLISAVNEPDEFYGMMTISYRVSDFLPLWESGSRQLVTVAERLGRGLFSLGSDGG